MRKLSAKSCVAGSAVSLRLHMACLVGRKMLEMLPRRRFWRLFETSEDSVVKQRFRRGYTELRSINASPGSVGRRFEVNQPWKTSRKGMAAVLRHLCACHRSVSLKARKLQTLSVAPLTVCH